MTPAMISLFGFAAWTLSLVVFGIGMVRISGVLRGQAKANAFRADVPHGSERYRRLMRAHVNCVENLPIFAVVVLSGVMLGVRAPAFNTLAMLLLGARLLQSITHIASGRSIAVTIRFGFFVLQIVCLVWMGLLVLWH